MNIVNSKYYCTACFAQQDPEFAPLFGSTVEVCSWRDARYHVQQLINAPLAPRRFVCKNNGVIFENQLLQIGLKSEYRQNLGEPHSNWTQTSETKSQNDSHRARFALSGRMYVFYGNKTSTQFLSFSSALASQDTLKTHILSTLPL